jgi:ribosomal RNA methyltransferase Nop2
MGRRAKNKQGDPHPLLEIRGKENQTRGAPSRQVGKRKADADTDAVDGGDSARPTKRAKGVFGKASHPVGKSKSVGRGGEQAKRAAGAKQPKSKQLAVLKPRAIVQEDEEEGGSSEGWEDVDEDEELCAEQRCVCFRFTCLRFGGRGPLTLYKIPI